MSRLQAREDFAHGAIPGVGVLLANLGTPDAPTTPALRRYLREFLSDPRVVELPRLPWWLILNALILPLRPRRSARLYATIWQDEGSPLLVTGRRQAAALEAALRKRAGTPVHVALGMRYGRPSIGGALRSLRDRGCTKVLVFPLYPQYASATTGSTFDAVARELAGWRWVPELRMVNTYHDHPAYVACLADSLRKAWGDGDPSDRLLFSFHGIPKRCFLAGDPYACHCRKTARLVAERLELPDGRWQVSFQSRFGREEWLQPYTDAVLRSWGEAGVAAVDVICPGFAADCLETLEEIATLNRGVFLGAGGRTYRYVPALNDGPDHIAALAEIARAHMEGWLIPRERWDEEAARHEAATSRERALISGAEQ